MPTLAEVVDAVVGGDTHRDTHALELTAPSGATIATLMIGNDERGFAEAIAWIAEHAPGPRWVVGLEGTRSYGIGLARVLQAAELTVVEIERPRRGSGGGASRTRSMPTWLRCTRCAWPLTGCPHRALTVTVRRHGIRGRGLPGCSRRGRHAAPAAHGSRRANRPAYDEARG